MVFPDALDNSHEGGQSSRHTYSYLLSYRAHRFCGGDEHMAEHVLKKVLDILGFGERPLPRVGDMRLSEGKFR